MPIEKTVLGLDFTQGLETQVDERIVQPGKLLTLQNAALDAARTIRRRDAWFHYDNSALSALNGLATFNDELLAIGGSTLYSVDTQNRTMTSRGTVPDVTIAKRQIYRSTRMQYEFDCASNISNSAVTAYVWRERDATGAGTNRGLYVTMVDETSGAVMLAPTSMIATTTATHPRVVYVASLNAFLVFYTDNPNLYCRVITPSTAALGAQTTLRTDMTGTCLLDACEFNGLGLVAYMTSNVTNSIFAIGVTQSAGTPSVSTGPLGVTTQAQLSSGGQLIGIACAKFNNTSAGIYAYGIAGGAYSGTWAAVISNAYAVTSAAAVKDATSPAVDGAGSGFSAITAALNGSTMYVFRDRVADWGGNGIIYPIRRIGLDSTNSITVAASSWANSAVYSDGTNGGHVNGPFISGKAFTIGSETFLPVFVGGQTKLQNAWFLLDNNANVSAKALYGTYGPGFTPGGGYAAGPVNQTLPSSPFVTNATLTGSTVICPVGEVTFASFDDGTLLATPGLSRLRVTAHNSGSLDTTAPAKSQVGQNTFISGGALTAYDGQAPTEAGFHLFPEGLKVVVGAAGGLVTIGAHQYLALYEWNDGSGQRHQSSPSHQSVTLGAVTYTAADSTHHATVTIPTLQLTAKPNVNIVIFRTVAAGTVFYRLNSINAQVYNDKTVAMLTFDDNVSDASLISGEVLYTTGGTLENIGPPSCTAMFPHQNRLFLLGLEDPSEFRYSQPQVTGFGLQWSDLLSGRVASSAAGLVAGASMDDRAILFSPNSICVVAGQGPNGSGGQNGFTAPTPLPVDVGCKDPRSVLVMPNGVMFKSSKGWYLLNRALQAEYIGGPVAAFDSYTALSAVLLQDRRQCRFTLSDGTTALVYDYVGGQWSTSINYNAADAVWWPAGAVFSYVHCASGGQVNGDFPGSYGDGGSSSVIPVTIDTAWLKMSQSLSGFQRVWRLLLEGPYTSSTSMTITAYVDYSSSAAATVTVSPTSTLANAAGNSWAFNWHLPIQKCKAIRFRIVDTPSTAGGGLGFSSMALECGIKKGAFKSSTAQRA